MIKKIGVVCAYQFPEGMAPTIRILAYCKGLQQNGVKCEIFTFKETPFDMQEPLSGVAEGIPYQKSYFKHGNGVCQKLCDKFSMLKRLKMQIRKSNESEPFDYILLSFDTLDKFYTIVPMVKSLMIKMLFIGDEYPEPIRRLREDIPIWHQFAYRFIHRYLKGRVLMTENLKKFYNDRAGVMPTYILNSIIDDKRFEGLKHEQVAPKYLCYMGNMQLAKDNVDNIIKAFAMVARDFPEYNLFLFGTPSPEDRRVIECTILQCHLEERVFIKGRVDYDKVPQILANATLLVTSQPITKRAQGGFPTKMAEYMMSGTPMVVTNVGEINKYVQDGINTYMVEPCNPDAYGQKLRYILSNPEDSARIANNALEYAKSNFCSQPVTKGLINFMNQLKCNGK